MINKHNERNIQLLLLKKLNKLEADQHRQTADKKAGNWFGRFCKKFWTNLIKKLRFYKKR